MPFKSKEQWEAYFNWLMSDEFLEAVRRRKMTKLTACKDCQFIEKTPLRYSCKAPPAQSFNFYDGEFSTPGECFRINTDGHCPHFKPKEEEK